MAKTIKICPKCGGKQFDVSAHVVQNWVVDENGAFLECTNACTEVTHEPDDQDMWTCTTCRFSDAGEKFNTVVEQNSPTETNATTSTTT